MGFKIAIGASLSISDIAIVLFFVIIIVNQNIFNPQYTIPLSGMIIGNAMTGQILSGTLPKTAILYQIAIMIAICTVVCLSVFGSLYFGYRTLYNDRNQIKY